MAGFVAVNAIIFAYAQSLPRPDLSALLNDVSFVVTEPSLLHAVLSTFFHENTLHLVANMGALWIFGGNVEDQLGRGRFLGLCVAGSVAGCYAAAWGAPEPLVSLVGANGTVAAVVGAYFAMFPHSRVLFLTPARGIVDAVELPALIVAGVWFGTLLTGGLGRLAEPWTGAGFSVLWAIAGGLAAGLLAGRVLRRPERRRVEWWGA